MICGREDVAPSSAKQSCVAKIVITGRAEENPDWQPHIRSSPSREALATHTQVNGTGKTVTDEFSALVWTRGRLRRTWCWRRRSSLRPR